MPLSRIGVWMLGASRGGLHVAREHAIPPLNPLGSRGQPSWDLLAAEGAAVEEIIDEPAELMERVAALGIGKAALTACVRYRMRPSREPACRRSATARRPPGPE